MGSVGQWATKLLAVKFKVLEKKSATSAIAAKVCTSVCGLGSSPPGFKSFSKFDGRQFCSSLTKRPYIASMKRSKPILFIHKSSKDW